VFINEAITVIIETITLDTSLLLYTALSCAGFREPTEYISETERRVRLKISLRYAIKNAIRVTNPLEIFASFPEIKPLIHIPITVIIYLITELISRRAGAGVT
jgi:hypothetical protein